MKRAVAVILSVLTLLAALAGCGSKKAGETMEIVTEEGKKTVPLVKMVTDVMWESTNLQNLLKTVPGNGIEFQISYEAIPRGEPERANYLTRMKTEMMAGKGPDLFVVDLEYGNFGYLDWDKPLEPVFAFPDNVMDNRLFLPLDEYMEKAEFSDLSKFIPGLMEAGRNGEGQQMIPLTFDFGVAVFDGGRFNVPLESTGSREDMLDSGDLALQHVAGSSTGLPLDPFGIPADYEKESLSFTEEELLQEAMLWREHSEKLRAGEYQSVMDQGGLAYGRICAGAHRFADMGDNSVLVPMRNRDGGVTACVRITAAINRNSFYPEQAFRVIDRLASESVMRDQLLYGWSGSMVANPELGSPDKPLQWFPMTEGVYESYRDLLDEITVYKFPTALEQAAYEMYVPVIRGELSDDGKLSAAVHKAYTTMEMMLAES